MVSDKITKFLRRNLFKTTKFFLSIIICVDMKTETNAKESRKKLFYILLVTQFKLQNYIHIQN